MVVVSRR